MNHEITMMMEEISLRLAKGGVDDAPGMDDRAETSLKLERVQLEDDFRQILVNNTVSFDATTLHRISTSPVPHFSHGFQTSTVLPLDGVISEVEEDVSVVSLELNGELDFGLVHPAAISKLKEIADRMILFGYEKECCLVYSSVRSHVLDECLRIIGIEKYSIEEVIKMEWITLYDQKEKWIQALKILVIRFLTGEKLLCEQVFAGSELMREVCFVGMAKGCVMRMLDFGKRVAICERSSKNVFRVFDRFDEVAICKGSSEKLFRILDMYDTLSDVMPDLEELFDGDNGAGESVCREAKVVLELFCVTASATFGEFERATLEDSASSVLENGDVHPLTKYVMSYVKFLVDYSEILNGVLEKTANNSELLQSDELQNEERMPCITRRLLILIKSLESNLEEKSRMYDDGGLQYVFLMNNVLHILNILKDPEVRNMLGDQCISKKRNQIRQYALSYLRSSWTKLSNCLSIEMTSVYSRSAKARVKVKLTKFNQYFEDLYRIQTAWKIADLQLRKELHILISENIVIQYRSFFKLYSTVVRVYIKHTPDDLSNYLLDLFEGSPCTIQTTEKKILPALLTKHCICS